MDSNLQAHATQAICRWLHEKYGYSKKECMAYIRGYEDATAFMDKQINLCSSEEYFRMTMNNDTVLDIVEGRGLKPLSPTK
jgi:hypothetical protein